MDNMYEIWSKVCSHQVTGLMYHFQFADIFYFLGLDNLGKDQECRYHEESKSLRKNHHFVLKHHNKIIVPRRTEGVDLIPSSWAKYSTNDIDKSTRKTQVVSILENWASWELRTKDLYTEMYLKATEQHAVADACRLKEMILSVEDELVRIHEYSDKLKMCDYSTEAMLSL